MNRRNFLLTTLALALASPLAQAQAIPEITVYKDPNCGCCGAWVARMKDAGFRTKVIESTDMGGIKAKLGVPEQLTSCHTAQVGGYVLEGHVPADAVKKLLASKPKVKGLAVPGMPNGSEGMEQGGRPDPYDVVAFDAAGKTHVFQQVR